MRRAAVVVAVVLAAAWWARPEAAAPPEPVRPTPAWAPPVSAGPSPADARPAPAPAPMDPAAPESLTVAAAAVRRACGLPGEVRCAVEGCAVLLEMPDLESPVGWARQAWRSPRFVANVLAREVGLPPQAFPCGAAVGALVGPDGVRVDERDGDELWCVGEAEACRAVGRAKLGREAFEGNRRLFLTPNGPAAQ